MLRHSKDIPVEPILRHLLYYNRPHKGRCGIYGNCIDGHWCLRYVDDNPSRIYNAFPDGVETPEKLLLSKMRKLINQELVHGCACGCRGDFEITAKGENYLSRMVVADD